MEIFPKNKQVNVLTALGGVPFLIFLLLPTYLWSALQLLGLTYLVVIISFIAGVNWCMACVKVNYHLLSWGIILSLLAWGLMGVAWLTKNATIAWIVGWALLNLAWIVDRKIYQSYPGLISLRLVGTMTLNVCIIMIIIRGLI